MTMSREPDRSKAVGLVGVGLVGTALAERLISHGYSVIGCDLVPERIRHLQDSGGRAVACPAELAAVADRVLLSLPDTAVVRRVLEGSNGLLEAATLPSYVIDTTTGDPEETMALAQCLAERNVAFLDATISGSSRQIGRGEGVFMVGGQEAAFEACLDIFRALSSQVFHLGPSGAGSKAKLATNLILGLNRLALAEGLVFADRLGLDLGRFLELVRVSPAYSAAVDTKGPKMLRGDFTPEARLRQHHKDVTLILKYAAQAAQELPLTAMHEEVLRKAIEAGDGELDNSAVIDEVRRRRTR